MPSVSINGLKQLTFNCTTAQYEEMYQRSFNEPELFWSEQSSRFITWLKPWSTIHQGSFDQLPVKWFVDGQMNISYDCVDKNALNHPDKIALIWEGNDSDEKKNITYSELLEHVAQMANVIKSFEIKKGDVVCLYLPMIPEAIYAMLACARIGAIHNVVFGGFSADSLKARIQDSQTKLVITANIGSRGAKIIPFKDIVDHALIDCESVNNVLVIERHHQKTPMIEGRDYWYHERIKKVTAICPVEPMDSNDPLFILYTSGSTGQPKGILHACGGYALYTALTYYYLFNHHETSIHWCTADVGWITGHSYLVYGPLMNGATTVVYEGIPSYPDFGRLWNIIEKYKVTNFYTAPTLIRALRHEGDSWVESSDLSSLEILGSVGEPINPEIWLWFFNTIGKGRCPIVNTWWQTEAGGIMLSAFPSDADFIPGSVGKPFFGINYSIQQDHMLYICNQWPGMMQTIYKNPSRMAETYFNDPTLGYMSGDGAYLFEDALFIAGRLDDIIKVSGHRLGTEEIESALVLHNAISESAVIGAPDEITGECLIVFAIPKKNIAISNQLNKEVIAHLREKIGAIATPKKICWVEGLPKTRSGKIMRRLLRKITEGEQGNLGDTSSLANPEILISIIESFSKI